MEYNLEIGKIRLWKYAFWRMTLVLSHQGFPGSDMQQHLSWHQCKEVFKLEYQATVVHIASLLHGK